MSVIIGKRPQIVGEQKIHGFVSGKNRTAPFSDVDSRGFESRIGHSMDGQVFAVSQNSSCGVP
ncbi:hypothetical protein [Halalkalicoccus salilacus]|uniref:hypothetical protein n=1 Tax=Halalkalicoccus salilacus TaxID=3117459 RepID=UPI00300F6265